MRTRRANTVRSKGSWRGFTLVELLVVIAIIGIVGTLLVPAVRGLVGVGGRRGAMNTLSTIIEKGRISAIESGEIAHIGFPFSASDSLVAYSSAIVLREDEAGNVLPASRWLRLPPGVFIELDPESEGLLQTVDLPEGTLPRLASANEMVDVSNLSVLTFDRFGRLKQEEVKEVKIRVGEKDRPGPQGRIIGGDNNYFLLTVQPLTGRVLVQDMSINSPQP